MGGGGDARHRRSRYRGLFAASRGPTIHSPLSSSQERTILAGFPKTTVRGGDVAREHRAGGDAQGGIELHLAVGLDHRQQSIAIDADLVAHVDPMRGTHHVRLGEEGLAAELRQAGGPGPNRRGRPSGTHRRSGPGEVAPAESYTTGGAPSDVTDGRYATTRPPARHVAPSTTCHPRPSRRHPALHNIAPDATCD